MRILMILLLIAGLFFLISGITAWVNAVNNDEALGVLVGLTFGISSTIAGGVLLFVDLLLVIFYKIRKRNQVVS